MIYDIWYMKQIIWYYVHKPCCKHPRKRVHSLWPSLWSQTSPSPGVQCDECISRRQKTYQGIVADFLPLFKKDFPPTQPVTQPGWGWKGYNWVAMDIRQIARNLIRCQIARSNQMCKDSAFNKIVVSKQWRVFLLNENNSQVSFGLFCQQTVLVVKQIDY